MNLSQTLSIGEAAWAAGGVLRQTPNYSPEPIGGLGEGFDEEDDSCVYQSDVKVSDLAFQALRSWCAAFLLGIPDFGR